jgi:integrase
MKALTVSRYRSSLADFAKFAKHDDPRRVTREEVRRWRDNLQSRGLRPKTINDDYLAGLKSVLRHGVKEFDLPANAAEAIRDEREPPAPTRSKDYTEEEAKVILTETFKGTTKAISPPHQRALFWVPWICAYTGLRVSEVTQFRGRNLRMEGDIPIMVITPEDGSTKSGKAWATVIHPHLVKLGLVEMLRSIGDGPAFYVPYPEGTDLTKLKRHRAKEAADRIAAWIKGEVGIEQPPGDRPNHAWRHLFTTLSRKHAMDKEARDYMMGSRSQTDAREGYGEWPPAALKREIDKLPEFKVEETDWRPTLAKVPPEAIRGAPVRKRRLTPRKPS